MNIMMYKRYVGIKSSSTETDETEGVFFDFDHAREIPTIAEEIYE